jgi:hypothetical protein
LPSLLAQLLSLMPLQIMLRQEVQHILLSHINADKYTNLLTNHPRRKIILIEVTHKKREFLRDITDGNARHRNLC